MLDIIELILFFAIGYVVVDVLSNIMHRSLIRRCVKNEALNSPDAIDRSINGRIYVRLRAGQEYKAAVKGSSAVIQGQLDRGILPVQFQLEK